MKTINTIRSLNINVLLQKQNKMFLISKIVSIFKFNCIYDINFGNEKSY